jgi:hypothetical protein
MTKFTVASEEGVQRYGGEVGDTVDLDLEAGEELAVVAAGWLEPEKKQKEAKQ